eukprot:gene11587-34289_t
MAFHLSAATQSGGAAFSSRASCRAPRTIHSHAPVPYSLQGKLRSTTICMNMQGDPPASMQPIPASPEDADTGLTNKSRPAVPDEGRSGSNSPGEQSPTDSLTWGTLSPTPVSEEKLDASISTADAMVSATSGGQPSDGSIMYSWGTSSKSSAKPRSSIKSSSAVSALPSKGDSLPSSTSSDKEAAQPAQTPGQTPAQAPAQPSGAPPNTPTPSTSTPTSSPSTTSSATPKGTSNSGPATRKSHPLPSTPATPATTSRPHRSASTNPPAPATNAAAKDPSHPPQKTSVTTATNAAAKDPSHPPQKTSVTTQTPPKGKGAAHPPAKPSAASADAHPFNFEYTTATARQAGASSAATPITAAQPAAGSSVGGSSPSPPSSTTSLHGAAAASSAQPTHEPHFNPSPSPPPSSPSAEADPSKPASHFRWYHFIIFAILLGGGGLFACMTLQFTSGMDFSVAATMVWRRLIKSVAFRQLVVITGAMLAVRFLLDSLLGALAKFSSNPVPWDKTKLYYILREVYQPLEVLLFIAALCTMADSFLPSLMSIPKATVSGVVRTVVSTSFIPVFASHLLPPHLMSLPFFFMQATISGVATVSGIATVSGVVRTVLSTSFILVFARVVFNLKSRFCKENAWQAEMKGDVTAQRRWEAYDKLGSFVIYVMSFVLGIQAIGLEVTSVLAIGGIGGLAIGLAGREICENLFNGFLIMSTVYVIPNAVFSKNIVLNVTRKQREWRFYEMIDIRLQDVQKANQIVHDIRRIVRNDTCANQIVRDIRRIANQIVQDIRRIVRNDTRVIARLHRRAFLFNVNQNGCKIYISFYVDASNQDSYMAMKQDLLLAFIDCVQRNGAKLASPHTVEAYMAMQQDLLLAFIDCIQRNGAELASPHTKLVDIGQEVGEVGGNINPAIAGLAAAQTTMVDIGQEVGEIGGNFNPVIAGLAAAQTAMVANASAAQADLSMGALPSSTNYMDNSSVTTIPVNATTPASFSSSSSTSTSTPSTSSPEEGRDSRKKSKGSKSSSSKSSGSESSSAIPVSDIPIVYPSSGSEGSTVIPVSDIPIVYPVAASNTTPSRKSPNAAPASQQSSAAPTPRAAPQGAGPAGTLAAPATPRAAPRAVLPLALLGLLEFLQALPLAVLPLALVRLLGFYAGPAPGGAALGVGAIAGYPSQVTKEQGPDFKVASFEELD